MEIVIAKVDVLHFRIKALKDTLLFRKVHKLSKDCSLCYLKLTIFGM
jgi:hypothetical protein